MREAVDAGARRQVRDLYGYLTAHANEMIEDLRQAVSLETPSDDKPLLDEFARHAADMVRLFGAQDVELIPDASHGDHVLAHWNGRSSGRPVMLLGHYDTVWPRGTIARLPLRRDGGRMYGPGVFDMKAGLIIGLWALAAYRELGGQRPVQFLMTSDEEIGSPSSQNKIRELARASAFSLVLEPALDNGNLKTARRGLALYRVSVTGRASHAGLAPQAGVSAIDELCWLVPEITQLAQPNDGTDINVGVISGGTRYNVVPAYGECEIGVRMRTSAEAERIDRAMVDLRPRHPEANITVDGKILWPPMERTDGVASLAARAREIAAEIGIEVDEGYSGGSSDACHCASTGAAVLDGLGAVGGGAHAEDEHVIVKSLPLRATIVAGLLATVGDELSADGKAP